MKRILIVMALTLLVALALAGPAVAGDTPQFGIYFWPFDGGSWAQYEPGGDPYNLDWQAPGTPMPAGQDLFVVGSWVGYTRGLIRNIPSTLLYRVDLDGATTMTYAEGKQYWTSMYVFESEDNLSFNGKIGAKMYTRDFWGAFGTTTSGSHDGILYQKFTHATTDLMYQGWEDVAQWHPYMFRAGVTEFPFSYVVQ